LALAKTDNNLAKANEKQTLISLQLKLEAIENNNPENY
jgi:hypothetical protein